MNQIKIEWLHDQYDCDHAGCSGGFSQGAKVWLNDDLIINCIPVASCFGGDHWGVDEIYALIFEKLGYKLTHE